MMHKTVHQKRVKLALATFLLCTILGSLTGHFGLQSYNQRLTMLSAGIFGMGILVLFVCLVHPFKWGELWFSYILNRLGRIGWLRRFEINQHAEGAITLTLLLTIWTIYFYSILGAGSYILNDLTTTLYLTFVYSWIFYSIHLHYHSLKSLLKLSEVINDNQKTSLDDKIKRITHLFNKTSVGFLIIGIIGFAVISTVWIDPQDNLPARCTFYAPTTSERPAFATVYPPMALTYYYGKFGSGLIFGFFAVVAELVLTTTILLLWLNSDEIEVTIDIYDPGCLKPVERLVNTFWLLTGAGLLLVPYVTVASSNSRALGFKAGANWLNYLSWTYIIFFAGIFLFSLTKFYTFVSAAKNSAEKQIKAELKDALKPRFNNKKLIAAKTKMRLLQGVKSRPTLSTLLQLIQIIAIVVLNLLIRLLE